MKSQTPPNMSLQGAAQSAPAGALGVDVDTPLSFDVAQTLRQHGYQFCARYLSLGTPQRAGDLSSQEAFDILRAGLAVLPVQHVLLPGWSPTEALGRQHGLAALQNARQLGIPPGVNVWCDLEGVAQGTNLQDIIDYCNAWHAAVADDGKGYLPGLYVGYDEWLNSTQLYESLSFQHYWSAPSATPVFKRGYQLVQHLPLNQTIAGLQVDVDVTQQDALGGNVQWLAPCVNPDMNQA